MSLLQHSPATYAADRNHKTVDEAKAPLVKKVSEDEHERSSPFSSMVIVLVEELSQNDDDTVTQRRIVRELLRWSEGPTTAHAATHRRVMMRAWGHAYVVGLVKRSLLRRTRRSQAYFVRDCFGLLLNLSFDETGRAVLARYPDMLDLCRHALQKYTGKIGVICDVCGLLCNLCYGDDAFQWRVTQSGIVTVVLGLLYQFPKSQTVQWSGITFFQHLLHNKTRLTEMRTWLRRAQALTVLRATLQEFQDDAVLYELTTWCIQELKKRA